MSDTYALTDKGRDVALNVVALFADGFTISEVASLNHLGVEEIKVILAVISARADIIPQEWAK